MRILFKISMTVNNLIAHINVYNIGWSSFYPSLTVVQHGIPCYEMQIGDLCLPPGHRDAINCDDSTVFDTFRR